MTVRRDDVAALLRRRILAGLHAGHLDAGARLPSTRELSARLDVDPRVVLAAYHELADEGLVEMRPRSGIYVAPGAPAVGVAAAPAAGWLVEVLAEGVRRAVPATALADWIRRAVATRQLRAAVVAETVDQREGIAGELRDDYGMAVDAVAFDALASGSAPVAELQHADLLVATEATEPFVRPLAERLGTPLVTASLRPDLVGGEWRQLVARDMHVVVADARFGEMARDYFAREVPGSRLQVLVAGADDVSAIPAEAPVYVTRSARERLSGVPVPGALVPTARTLSAESARAILALMVHANLKAAAAAAPSDAERAT